MGAAGRGTWLWGAWTPGACGPRWRGCCRGMRRARCVRAGSVAGCLRLGACMAPLCAHACGHRGSPTQLKDEMHVTLWHRDDPALGPDAAYKQALMEAVGMQVCVTHTENVFVRARLVW